MHREHGVRLLRPARLFICVEVIKDTGSGKFQGCIYIESRTFKPSGSPLVAGIEQMETAHANVKLAIAINSFPGGNYFICLVPAKATGQETTQRFYLGLIQT
jgi:hypothetical protein